MRPEAFSLNGIPALCWGRPRRRGFLYLHGQGGDKTEAAAFAAARSLPPVGGSDAHDAREVGNAYTELTAEALTVPALRAALAAGRSRAVLARNTAHVRKGLSQWTKALRRGGVLRLGKAAAYVCWCAWLDVTDRR